MTTATLITMSADDMADHIAAAVRKAMLQLENRTAQSVLSVQDIAKDSGFSADTVRSWIQHGRTAPGGKTVKLKVMDGISDTYRIRWEAYRAFLAEFPDIVCPTPKR
ncbi:MULTISPECIES: hypothetical protein [unclassified Spirosoma]|uniref:hypothetical protein n=1 Tax=unclassified Spirosoma TaxID=2621999 RepID=UPI00096510A9|nr:MULTISPECIES: hypothetical protein [unclassified Spirosoma]MBN8825104.1 hypothetical protein [Spirosoma sp.]OJW77204.1 MAG: hypothetical protein BGO59_31620 [Spirosoma sp. 48-14]